MNISLDPIIQPMTTYLSGIQAIMLRGSHLGQDEIDFWSDLDVLVVLEPGLELNEEQLDQSIAAMGLPIGCEKFKSAESIMVRAAIVLESSVQLLDATVCTYNEWVSVESTVNDSRVVYGSIELQDTQRQQSNTFSFSGYQDRIDSIWLKYFITLKKFARNDYLIGMHLLLDLVREFLVVEMIERDIKHQTNIHRFGYKESFPESLHPGFLDKDYKKEIFYYIDRLAQAYDAKLVANIEGYSSHYKVIADYISDSIDHLSDNQ